MDKRKFILALLLIVLIMLFVRNVGRQEQGKVEELTYKTGVVKAGGHDTGSDLPRLKKELLHIKRESFMIGGRGILEPLTFARKKVPKPKPEPVKPQPKPEPEPVVVETAMERAVAQFTFLGFLESEKVKTIFLTRDGEILTVKEGDTILEKYVIKSITDNSMLASSLDGSEILEINLIENEPLKKNIGAPNNVND